MLSDSLNTNQVKNSAGVEVEFTLKNRGEGRAEWLVVNEPPSLPHRMDVRHSEMGEGIKKRRRSTLGFTKTVMSDVDETLPVGIRAYVVTDSPVGALATNAEIANVLAELISILASTGADSTIKFDCTGNGAAALLNQTL